jgi:hypothetical protein
MECLPEGLRGACFYAPGEAGFEAKVKARMAEADAARAGGGDG